MHSEYIIAVCIRIVTMNIVMIEGYDMLGEYGCVGCIIMCRWVWYVCGVLFFSSGVQISLKDIYILQGYLPEYSNALCIKKSRNILEGYFNYMGIFWLFRRSGST